LDHHVAQGAATNSGDRAEDHGLYWSEAELECLAGTGDREEAEAGCVEDGDRAREPVELSAEEERDQGSGSRDGEVASR
jgi:hypothetical protein